MCTCIHKFWLTYMHTNMHTVEVAAINRLLIIHFAASKILITHWKVPRVHSEASKVKKPCFVARSKRETPTEVAVPSLGWERWCLHELVTSSVAADSVRCVMQGLLVLWLRNGASLV